MEESKVVSLYNHSSESNLQLSEEQVADSGRSCPNHAVQKGIYDIHYAIKLLRSIEEMVDKLLMRPQDLQMTLKTSLRKMICYLEVERDQM